MIQCDSRYVAVMDSLMASEEGFKLALTTSQVMPVSYGGAGTKTLTLAKATANLRSILVASQATADLGDGTKFKSAFPPHTFASIYTVVGSRRFPEAPDVGYARAFQSVQDGAGVLGNVLGGGIIDAENYALATTGGQVPDANCATWMWGYNFDKVKTESISLDGESTNSVGGQCQIYLENTAPTSATLTAVVDYTRFIQIASSRVSLMG